MTTINTTHFVQRELNFRRQIRYIVYNFIYNLILFIFILITSIVYAFLGFMTYNLCMLTYLFVVVYKNDCFTCINQLQKVNQDNSNSNIISSYIY